MPRGRTTQGPGGWAIVGSARSTKAMHRQQKPRGAARDPFCCDSPVCELFAKGWHAIAFCILMLIAVLLMYVLIQIFRERPGAPWKGSISMQPSAYFVIQYDTGKMKKYFSPDSISEFRESLEKEAGASRKNYLQRRRDVLERTRSYAWRAFGAGVSPDAASAPSPLNVAIQGGVVPSDGAFEQANLNDIAEWLRARLNKIDQASRLATHQSLIASLERVEQEEQLERKRLESQIQALEPPLYFNWVYHEGAGWVLEISVWSIIGALANALIAVIRACSKGKYDPCRFVMLIPKLVLAPVLALVFTAIWAAGISQSGVSFLNLPYFLVWAFVLGFGTEQLFSKLRRVVQTMLGEASIDPKKLKERGGKGDPGGGGAFGGGLPGPGLPALPAGSPVDLGRGLEGLRSIAKQRVAAIVGEKILASGSSPAVSEGSR